ncbi:hypothetical protein GCM10011360_17820 [Primorskyibacter flagellatus]|uniref:Uncharacterized protein n=1 Tax=Primorskyibacter flagellatus TaxID=1387277 RepID=A0A917A631_9RHOB|nr:hypothetical protein [Primorskyibacter flagellatus]GGE30198.1 hypothetical protein GCM10011360_17820 [Primorskyibacter flagellatus]
MPVMDFADDLAEARKVLHQQSSHPVSTIIDAAEALSLYSPDKAERLMAGTVVNVARRSSGIWSQREAAKSVAACIAIAIIVIALLSLSG